MRYIDADKLIDDIRPFAEYDSTLRNKDWVRRFEVAIDAQPTADVRENVKGEWIYTPIENGMIIAMCSICKKVSAITPSVKEWYRFCPNCGADMRGGNDD